MNVKEAQEAMLIGPAGRLVRRKFRVWEVVCRNRFWQRRLGLLKDKMS
jgi:hypothetical protein